jgi:hypothetical protein
MQPFHQLRLHLVGDWCLLDQNGPCIECLFHRFFYLIGKHLLIDLEMAGRPFKPLQTDKAWIFRSAEFERSVVPSCSR